MQTSLGYRSLCYAELFFTFNSIIWGMLAPTWAYEFARLGSTRGNYNSRFIVADFWALIKFLCLHKRSDSQSNNNSEVKRGERRNYKKWTLD